MGEMTDPSKGVTGPRRNRQGRQRMDHLVVNKILERERKRRVSHAIAIAFAVGFDRDR